MCPPGTFKDVTVYETDASRAGLCYTAAGGHSIVNLGMCKPIIQTLDGSQYCMGFQVAAVSKPLGAVSRITSPQTDVIFRHESRGPSVIKHVITGHEIPLRKSGGVWFLDVWVKPGNEQKPQDFPRQGK